MKKIYFLSACLLTGATMAQTVEQDGHTYMLVESNEISWSMADVEANKLGDGWHLATVTSAKEQKAIEKLLKNKQSEYWLGAYKDAANNWNWVSGEEFAYNNWAVGEPNNFLERTEQNIAVWERTNWKWNDEGFMGHIGGYIVEFDGEDQALSTVELNSSDMDIYPNPNKGEFTVNLNSQMKGSVQLNVFNVVGSVVHTDNLMSNGSGLRHDLNLSNLAPGAYWVKLSSGQQSITKKVVITQ